MRKLFFVGKAPPEDKAKHNTPFPSGEVTDLVALDPRHGVFPNLVMTPLFATIMAFYEDGDNEQALELLEQSKVILADTSPRRFNVLCKPTDETRTLDPDTKCRIDTLDTDNDLWLVFKHSSVFALLSYLFTGETKYTESTLNEFGDKFLAAATSAPGCRLSVPPNRNTQVGLLFQLFAGVDEDGSGAVSYIAHAMNMLAPNKNHDRLLKVLRSIVPLLHNDAYDKPVVGLIQSRFMTGIELAVENPRHDNPPADVYWRFIGRAIKRRLTTPTTPLP